MHSVGNIHSLHAMVKYDKAKLASNKLIWTHFSPMFHFYTPEDVRKPLWRFQGLQKRNIGLKWITKLESLIYYRKFLLYLSETPNVDRIL